MTQKKWLAWLDRDNAPKKVMIFLLVIYCLTNFTHRNWTRHDGPIRGVIKWDIVSYYSYLPAIFIKKDIRLDFMDNAPEEEKYKFFYAKTETGGKVIITSMGLSYLYAPFFFAAHALAPVFGEPRDGFQSINQFFLVFSALLYLGFGFYFLWKLLTRYFSPRVTAITLFLIGMGTNLYYYSTHEAAMSHSYSFSLIAIFLFLLVRWYEDTNWKNSVFLGLVYGLIVLIRPSNVLLAILILLWEVDSFEALWQRIRFLTRKSPMILVMLAAFILPWIPQMLYWKEVAGSFLYNSYQEVGSSFYFDNPHVMDLLFSYRKGWFVYTPLMLFAVVGFIPLLRLKRGLFIGPLLYLMVMIYVFSSWWSWWTGGSFGIRSLIDLMAVMALPLAALITSLGKQKKWLTISGSVLIAFVVFLSIFQTRQYQKVLIHWVGMTKESYWAMFLRAKDQYGYWQNLTEPDYQLARKGIYVYYPILGKDERLLAMSEEEGKEYVLYNLRRDKSLRRDIRRYCKRTDTSKQDALDMVVDRAYEQLTAE
jgi:hypothetical protein